MMKILPSILTWRSPIETLIMKLTPMNRKTFLHRNRGLVINSLSSIWGGGASGTSGGNKQVLEKIAVLVRQEQALLQEAGVPIPAPPGRPGQQQTGVSLPDPVSEVVPPGPTLSTRAREAGAIPKKKPPKVKPGETTCPVCKSKFTQHSKLKADMQQNMHTQVTLCVAPA